MSAETPSTIVLKNFSNVDIEAPVSVEMTPGCLVTLNSAGKFAAGTQGAYTPKLFLKEDELQGKTIDDNYTAGTKGFAHQCYPGEEIYALLPIAATAVVVGSLLMAYGDGTVALATGDLIPVAQALEAVDNSSGTVPARVKIRVL